MNRQAANFVRHVRLKMCIYFICSDLYFFWRHSSCIYAITGFFYLHCTSLFAYDFDNNYSTGISVKNVDNSGICPCPSPFLLTEQLRRNDQKSRQSNPGGRGSQSRSDFDVMFSEKCRMPDHRGLFSGCYMPFSRYMQISFLQLSGCVVTSCYSIATGLPKKYILNVAFAFGIIADNSSKLSDFPYTSLKI